MGDPAGIGPEIAIKALLRPEIYEICRPILVGEAKAFEFINQHLHLGAKFHLVKEPSEGKYVHGTIDLLDLDSVSLEGISFGELTEKLTPLITEEKGKTVKIKPKMVVSVTYQEIQRSPNYSSGFALRFPRFTALRTDKPLSEISTLKEVEKDFTNQKRNLS